VVILHHLSLFNCLLVHRGQTSTQAGRTRSGGVLQAEEGLLACLEGAANHQLKANVGLQVANKKERDQAAADAELAAKKAAQKPTANDSTGRPPLICWQAEEGRFIF